MISLELVAFVPDQSPEAVHESVFGADQVNVTSPPFDQSTLVGELWNASEEFPPVSVLELPEEPELEEPEEEEEPVSEPVVLGLAGFAVKVAKAARSWFIEMMHDPLPKQSPPHPANVYPASGVATRVTVVLLLKEYAHDAPQAMPDGLLETYPLPDLMTVNNFGPVDAGVLTEAEEPILPPPSPPPLLVKPKPPPMITVMKPIPGEVVSLLPLTLLAVTVNGANCTSGPVTFPLLSSV